MREMDIRDGHTEPLLTTGTALVSAEAKYIDGDPVVLDLYGVTLDVLREKRIGDFSPPEYGELERLLWSLWVSSGLEHAEGGGTVLRPDDTKLRVWANLDRLPDGTFRITLEPVDEPTNTPPSLRVQNVLGHWRDLERHLAELPSGDSARRAVEARIEALREEYQRRVSGR